MINPSSRQRLGCKAAERFAGPYLDESIKSVRCHVPQRLLPVDRMIHLLRQKGLCGAVGIRLRRQIGINRNFSGSKIDFCQFFRKSLCRTVHKRRMEASADRQRNHTAPSFFHQRPQRLDFMPEPRHHQLPRAVVVDRIQMFKPATQRFHRLIIELEHRRHGAVYLFGRLIHQRGPPADQRKRGFTIQYSRKGQSSHFPKGKARCTVGLNARLDTLQAAVLLPKLHAFPKENEHRRWAAARYAERLSGRFQLQQEPEGYYSSFGYYTILTGGPEERERLQDALKARGIPTMVYYPCPLHLQKVYLPFGYRRGDLPVCESLAGRVLSLPMHGYITEEEIGQVCDALLNG